MRVDELRDALREAAESLAEPVDGRAAVRRRVRAQRLQRGLPLAAVAIVVVASVLLVADRRTDSDLRVATEPGSSVPACTAKQLETGARLGRSDGAIEGEIWFMNRSTTSCTVAGHPRVEILDGDQALPVKQRDTGARDDPVTLRPQRANTATLGIAWHNWCHEPPARAGILVTLPSSGGQLMGIPPDRGFVGVPSCDDPGEASRIVIRPSRTRS